MLVLGLDGTRGQGEIKWWQGLVKFVENRDFEFEYEMDLQVFVQFDLCNENLKKCERDGLDLLPMIHNTQGWWWNFKNKRIAKLLKVRLLPITKSLNFA